MEKKIEITIAVLVVAVFAFILFGLSGSELSSSEPKKFSSLEELSEFLEERESKNYYGFSSGGFSDDVAVAEASSGRGADSSTTVSAPSAEPSSEGSGSVDYSSTNVQVAGVDEADIMKNDGEHIYTALAGSVSIIKAYPAGEAELLSTIELENRSIQNIYVNGDKLVVFGSESYYYGCPECRYYRGASASEPFIDESGERVASDIAILPPRYYSPKSFIYVYDITDREDPELENSLSFEGSHYTSRMIGDHVYAVASQPISRDDDNVSLPEVDYNGESMAMDVREITYFDFYDNSYVLTSVFVLDLEGGEISRETFMTGYSQNIFVSQDNIYLTSTQHIPYEDYILEMTQEVYLPLLDSESRDKARDVLDLDISSYSKQREIEIIFRDYYNSLSTDERGNLDEELEERSKNFNVKMSKEYEKTLIYKISVDGNDVSYSGSGEVPGSVLNQFSMDEHDGNFRVVTTTGNTWDETSLNHVYVLGSDLNVIGSVEDIAPTERIYSARFLGDKVFMVTFRQIDPFFVIDLSNPSSPEVLGELKIPGYSTYLHPYGEDYIIGIGKEATESNFTDSWSGVTRPIVVEEGVKLSLFDVSDFSDPREVAKYEIGGRGTDSIALYEHKAFLFDEENGILVVPISLREPSEPSDPFSYGEQTFEGAYVFSVSEEGFDFTGRISHMNSSEIEMMKDKEIYYYPYNSQIMRSTYIEDSLYTFSNKFLKAHSLEDLEEEASISLPFEEESYIRDVLPFPEPEPMIIE